MEKPFLKFDSSWDDGERDDIKIAGILKFHRLVGTFYIPTICDLSAVDINVFLGEFDIGGHTVYHPPDIKKLDYDRVLYELMENKRWLESILDRKITRFAYPRGRYNEETIRALKESGYKEARTTVILKTDDMVDPYRINTTIHTFPRPEYNGKDWVEVAKDYAKFASLHNGLFHIWGHSSDLNRYQYWDKLDKFFGWLRNNYQLTDRNGNII